MTTINIKTIEAGLVNHETVTSAFDVGEKHLFLIATYDERIFSVAVEAISKNDPDTIEPDADAVEIS